MVDTVTVSSKDEFVQEIVSNEDLELTDDGAEELWRVWSYRYESGVDDDVLVALPSWFSQEQFGKNRPYFFANVEYDNEEKKAVLFGDARIIDINVIENGIWDDVTITETLEVVDRSTDEDSYVDERGLVWCPRSLMTVYERDT